MERPQGGKIYPSSDPGDLEINRAPFGREAQESRDDGGAQERLLLYNLVGVA